MQLNLLNTNANVGYWGQKQRVISASCSCTRVIEAYSTTSFVFQVYFTFKLLLTRYFYTITHLYVKSTSRFNRHFSVVGKNRKSCPSVPLFKTRFSKSIMSPTLDYSLNIPSVSHCMTICVNTDGCQVNTDVLFCTYPQILISITLVNYLQ